MYQTWIMKFKGYRSCELQDETNNLIGYITLVRTVLQICNPNGRLVAVCKEERCVTTLENGCEGD